VWITYDPAADALYIYLTSDPVTPGRTTILWGSITGSDLGGLPGWDHR